jgi:hypothetical protein
MRVFLSKNMSEPVSQWHTKHTFSVSWPQREPEGFLPMRWGVQLTDSYDNNPSYVLTSGAYIMQSANYTILPNIIAALWGKRGWGNPKRYKSETNLFYMRLQLPYDLPPTSNLTIQLPEGYTCESVSRVPNDLPAFGASFPSGNGFMPAGPGAEKILEANYWSYDRNFCVMRMDAELRYYQNQRFYFYVVVTNPAVPLSRFDPSNFWKVDLETNGEYLGPGDDAKYGSYGEVANELYYMFQRAATMLDYYQGLTLTVFDDYGCWRDVPQELGCKGLEKFWEQVLPFAPLAADRNKHALFPHQSLLLHKTSHYVELPRTPQQVMRQGELFTLLLPDRTQC